MCGVFGAERATRDILDEFLSAYGKVPDPAKEEKRLGQMYTESTTGIIADYGLPLTIEEYSEAVHPLYLKRFVPFL
jgi:riboflavin kinase / FMN hydrolase